MFNQIPDEYIAGVVILYDFKWKCYYKFCTDDMIEMYCEIDNFEALQYTHYKSLTVRGDK